MKLHIGELFGNINHLWETRGFEIMMGLILACLIIVGLYRKITGKRGTWSNSYYYSELPATGGGSEPASHLGRKVTPQKDSKGEVECRRVLQYLFKKRFDKCRPDFLRNPVTGGNFNLELDCYDEELKLGVEYNGAQHYKYIPYFHRNKDVFTNQKYRDDLKRRLCRDVRVNLVEVPYTVKLGDIKGYLEKELRRIGYKF